MTTFATARASISLARTPATLDSVGDVTLVVRL
jgi:hypothetical protein